MAPSGIQVVLEVLEAVAVAPVVVVVEPVAVQERLAKEMMVVVALQWGLTSVVVVAEDLEQLEPLELQEHRQGKLVMEVLEHQTQ
jgi:hypothetical protein